MELGLKTIKELKELKTLNQTKIRWLQSQNSNITSEIKRRANE